MEIKASDVKALRDKTGAGMMECKKALVDSNGDPAAAEKLLKEKGLAAVAKRSDRAAGEGRIFVKQDGNRIAIVEMTCETDFVAKNDDFIALGEKLVSITLEKNYTEVAQEHKDLMQELAIKIRENMEVRRVALVTIPENAVASTYVHHNFKIGAVVVVKGSTDEKVAHFAHECCLHLAVNNPSYIQKKKFHRNMLLNKKKSSRNKWLMIQKWQENLKMFWKEFLKVKLINTLQKSVLWTKCTLMMKRNLLLLFLQKQEKLLVLN
jgi:elongation factor Ts